jgi:hypothetical protein
MQFLELAVGDVQVAGEPLPFTPQQSLYVYQVTSEIQSGWQVLVQLGRPAKRPYATLHVSYPFGQLVYDGLTLAAYQGGQFGLCPADGDRPGRRDGISILVNGEALGNGTWCPTVPPWTESVGPQALFAEATPPAGVCSRGDADRSHKRRSV